MPTETKHNILSKETMLPLGFVIIMAGVVYKLSSEMTTIQHRLDKIDSRLEDQWTRRDMENYGLKFQLANPELKVPEVN